jgi:hypothetical protein
MPTLFADLPLVEAKSNHRIKRLLSIQKELETLVSLKQSSVYGGLLEQLDDLIHDEMMAD